MRNSQGDSVNAQDVCSIEPASLPVHLNEVKAHLRIGADVQDEDSLINGYIREAVRSVEHDASLAIVAQTRVLYLDQWPIGSIELMFGPVRSVESIVYIDGNGNEQTLDSDQYQVNASDSPARIRPAYGVAWPVARMQERSIAVTYVAGSAIPVTAEISGSTLTAAGAVVAEDSRVRVSHSGGSVPQPLVEMRDYFAVDVSGLEFGLSATEGGSAISFTTTGSGLLFVGEVNNIAKQAILLRCGSLYADREGAEHARLDDAYWSRIYRLKEGGW